MIFVCIDLRPGDVFGCSMARTALNPKLAKIVLNIVQPV
jgi:hypothetical protein